MDLLLADDHVLVRDALAGMLRHSLPRTQVHVACGGAEALVHAEQVKPDIAVIDYNMPSIDGLETVHRLRKQHQNMSIICLTIHHEQSLIRRMFEAGADGYVSKDDRVEVLLEAINAVQNGRYYLSPKLQGAIDLTQFKLGDRQTGNRGYAALTGKQLEVLKHIASGANIREIASEMGLSTKTLDTHRRRIQEKLEVDSIADLTRIAIREGLILLDDEIPEKEDGTC